ncbi:adenine-N(1)--methyltransferase-like protein [Hortaea werneckii]|uniref:tRNA (adenine(58)-N(1))-methyltransferase catalytic subunit TRM61 n=1 Tax=Hortaea werneckii TaxID=91943 RepID=A0A3M7G7M6_HORWE|nr:adenine-N(1)--methyltransferase-like protein [Hortaea werneckii]KAI7606413.1 adenine-N(1)--methyltransferase-like protein [Hortaea werneckii]KAI7613726.1 adenine-N(1)--methyltransferase-like protein [Hortaea werneckii]KAI7639511.1 adenine-N(1)--methyltransferase-like protein [Hortaea werneckii]KAI7687644.1 adenine-N(1)--methyltransferase-like protein [Hortaea werneckii]
MPMLWRAFRQAPISRSPTCQVRRIADARPFRENDLAVLRPKNDRYASPVLTRPLQAGKRIDTHRGTLHHNDILFKHVRDVVRTAPTKSGKQAGTEYRLHEVKLEEYVRLTKRLVTPLYPQDARLIVDLLDLHPEPPTWAEEDGNKPKLEILEAGTGHGALTVYLSRAIHAANTPFPQRTMTDEDEVDHVALEQWKASRRAVLHTIEISAKYSAHARTVVEGFRHGQYAHNVDFHVGNVSEWASAALVARNEQPFLSHAFLDLPGAEEHLSSVAQALRTDGTLIIFNPSITQIMASFSKVKEDGLPLVLDRVIELGVNGGTGGREWDIRAVKPRAQHKKSSIGAGEDDSGAEDGGVDGTSDDVQEPRMSDGREGADEGAKDEGWKMVCRPKVGDSIVGGGFLGIFEKQR